MGTLCSSLRLDCVHLESLGQFGRHYNIVKNIEQWQSKRESTALEGAPFTEGLSKEYKEMILGPKAWKKEPC